MAKKPGMSVAAINTIIASVPVIIDTAARLIRMIREQKNDEPDQMNIPMTIEGLKEEMRRVDRRLAANSESDVEQIKLIEELARQNAVLAKTLEKTAHQVNVLIVIAIVALLFGALAVVLAAS